MKMCEWYILITHDNCTCIFHDLSKLFSSAHEVYRFRRALPCFYPGKVTVTIHRSKWGGMFKMLLWDFWQRMGHELINIHLGTDDSPFVVHPWYNTLSRESCNLISLLILSNVWMFLPCRPCNRLLHNDTSIVGFQRVYISCCYVRQT